MAKVEITIRCVKCNAKETVVIPAWAALRTSCGCNGPYQVLERKPAPEEPPAPDGAKESSKKSAKSSPAKDTEAPLEPSTAAKESGTPAKEPESATQDTETATKESKASQGSDPQS